MKKRLLAFLLASTLVCALLPITAGAVTVTEVVPCKYDEVEDFSEGLAAVELNGKWGFIDITGKEVVPLGKYDYVNSFSEGLAAVRLEGKQGFIDTTGKEVIPCTLEYNRVSDFSDGLAAVALITGEKDKRGLTIYKWGFIDATGKEVVPCKYDQVENFSDGLAAVGVGNYPDDKWGFIDATGKEVVPCKYDYVENFSEGLAYVSLSDKRGFIDKAGAEVVPLGKYDWVCSFSEGLAGVQLDGKWGFIDTTGKEIIPCTLECDVEYFHEGFAMTSNYAIMGFIDKTGKEIVPLEKYGAAHNFSEGLAALLTLSAEKFGFVDTTGKEVIPFQYDNTRDFSEGLAAVELDGKWGFIDKTGKEVVPCKYEKAGDFSNGLAAVKLNGKWGFLSISDVSAPTTPDTYTAKATNDKLTVDGVSKAPTAYKVNNANYFQLRDVAVLLNSTKAQFSVEYDNAAKAIKITTGEPYQPNGKEMKGAKATAEAIVGNNDVYINGVKTDFVVYKIGGSNFFQIRDLGKALGFNVDWAKDVGIIIDPSKPYSGK